MKKIIIFLLILSGFTSFGSIETPVDSNIKKHVPSQTELVLYNYIKTLETMDVVKYNSSRIEISDRLGSLQVMANQVIETKNETPDTTLIGLVNALEKKLSNYQVENFPILRYAFCEYLKKELSGHGIKIECEGENNTIIKLVAKNNAIKNVNFEYLHDSLHKIAIHLRFKTIDYHWDENLVFSLSTKSDSEIIKTELKK